MSTSNFQQLLANMADDVRHNVVEKPYFGKEVTGNITVEDVAHHAGMHVGAHAALEEFDPNVEPGSVWDDQHGGTVWGNENDPDIGRDRSQGGIETPEFEAPEFDLEP